MKSFLKKHHFSVITILAAVSVFGIGLEAGKYLEKKAWLSMDSETTQEASIKDVDMAAFWKAYAVLNDKFVATASSTVPTNDEKVLGAIQGLAASYNDPYTVFFPPEESKQFEDQVRGDFGGVGMEIGIKDDGLVVVAPLKNTPAERAGLKAGDPILKIDKKYTDGMTVEDAVSLIRGPKGTPVVITTKKDGAPKEITLVRETITIPVMDTELREDGVFVISLYSFSANSAPLFRDALRKFIESGADKLVLDLRNNPGGFLESAVEMASFFLPVGKPIVIEDTGAKTEQYTIKSKGYNVFTDKLKMVVLINEGSASASEILAGALRDHGIVKLVGEKSFGKGSVQELVEITPETSLKVTIARWLTPKGISISQDGIEPDIKIEITEADAKKKYDTQLEKAVAVLLDPNFKR